MSQLARNSDPQTSHDAAARVPEFNGKHVARILLCLEHFGPLTTDEIASHTKLQSQQVNKRLPELRSVGSVCDTGYTRPSASNRQETVWSVM